jgi:hypothetical protein
MAERIAEQESVVRHRSEESAPRLRHTRDAPSLCDRNHSHAQPRARLSGAFILGRRTDTSGSRVRVVLPAQSRQS